MTMGKDPDKQTGLFGGLREALARSRRSVSEEEIKELVDDNDELLEDEKRMIGEILELDELCVSDIMQPRVDIMAVEDDETVRQALERMRGTGYSRLPVFHDDLDHIVGIVHYKDLIPAVLDGETDALATEHMRRVLFVPETKDLFPLLSEMQTKRQQMAIVVDEYGGTDGLITVEDILEEIVGDIADETDFDDPYLTAHEEGEWVVDGRLSVEDAIELGWPVDKSDGYDTIAGWFMDMLGAVPQVGAELTIGGYLFKVRSMRRRRVREMLVKRVGEDRRRQREA